MSALDAAVAVARVGQAMSELRPGIRGRELEVVRWLVERGAPVLAPVHDAVLERGGYDITLWPYVESREADGEAAGQALVEVRAALAGCPSLGGFWPLTEMRVLIERQGCHRRWRPPARTSKPSCATTRSGCTGTRAYATVSSPRTGRAGPTSRIPARTYAREM